jgi:hypothetical protein
MEIWSLCNIFYGWELKFRPWDEKLVLESDFKLLTTLLMGYLSVSLISSSDNMWYVTMEKLKRKKKKLRRDQRDKKVGVGMGMAIGLGVIGAIMAVKKNMLG